MPVAEMSRVRGNGCTLQVLTAMNHHTYCLHVSQHSDSVVVDLLFSVAPIVCGGSVFGLCFVIQNFVSI